MADSMGSFRRLAMRSALLVVCIVAAPEVADVGVVRACGAAANYDECTLSALSMRHFSATMHQTVFAGAECKWAAHDSW